MLLALGTPATAAATATATAAAPGRDDDFADRTLAGHTFLYPTFQQSPFNTTFFGVRAGFFFFHVPALPRGTLGLKDLNLGGVDQTAEFSLKLGRFVGVHAGINGSAVTGVDGDSLLVQGGKFRYELDLGAVIRAFRIERTGTQLAVRGGLSFGGGRDIRVGSFLDAILATRNVMITDVATGTILNNLLAEQSSFAFGASAHLAQALTRYFGLQASLRFARTQTNFKPWDDTSKAYLSEDVALTTIPEVGVALTADAAPAGVPFATLFEYQFSRTTEDTTELAESAHVVAGGIFYSGRRDLMLGFVGATQLGLLPVSGKDQSGAPALSGNPHSVYAQFTFRYVW